MEKKLNFKNISVKMTVLYAVIFSIALMGLNIVMGIGIYTIFTNQGAHQIELTEDAINDRLKDPRFVMFLDTNHEPRPYQESLTEVAPSEFRPDEIESVLDREYFSELGLNADLFVIINDGSGKQLTVSHQSASDEFSNMLNSKNSIEGQVQKLEYEEHRYLYEVNCITLPNKDFLYVQIVKKMDVEYDFLKKFAMLMLLLDGFIFMVAIVAGYAVSRKMLHPIDHMTRAAQKISTLHLSERLEVSETEDELSRLSHTFNDMLERLEVGFTQQKRFVSDASHELRTPIAVIRGYIDMLNRWGKSDPEVLDKAILAIQKETMNMNDMMEKLLFLAKAEQPEYIEKSIHLSEISLNDVIEELVSETQLIEPTCHLVVDMLKTNGIQDENTIVGDENLLKQGLRAIMENSLKYSEKPCKIHIHLSQDAEGNSLIKIEDEGGGIPEEALPNITDRFFRVDEARTRGKGGSGLGLSIVKEIVKIHHGELNLYNGTKGLVVEIKFVRT